jgi:hypothetical protein
MSALVVLSLVAAGCGKSSSTQASSVTSRPAQTTPAAQTTPVAQTTPAVLTQAQVITAGDAICTTTIKQLTPLMARLDAIQKSGASKQEIYLRTGPPIEEIARGPRLSSRLLDELHPPASDKNALSDYASSLLELSTIEEQLAQSAREEETVRIAPVTKEVVQNRAYARTQAKAFGFRVCGASARTPVG